MQFYLRHRSILEVSAERYELWRPVGHNDSRCQKPDLSSGHLAHPVMGEGTTWHTILCALEHYFIHIYIVVVSISLSRKICHILYNHQYMYCWLLHYPLHIHTDHTTRLSAVEADESRGRKGGESPTRQGAIVTRGLQRWVPSQRMCRGGERYSQPRPLGREVSHTHIYMQIILTRPLKQ